MRADRLLSMLMLLQSRGRMTARELAGELEVSERTIYRDLTALSTAGVALYGERGPGGGVSLIEEYTTSLTGLSPEEARALFMLNVPSALDQLGVGAELKAALRKLAAALPESRRHEEALARTRIHLDSSWWFHSNEGAPCLPVLQRAVWEDRLLDLRFRSVFGRELQRVVAPYGLVAKAHLWHLVYAWQERLRVVRVSQVMQAAVREETFVRRADFDLASFWEGWCVEYEAQPPFLARVRLAPEALGVLPLVLEQHDLPRPGEEMPRDEQGWVTLELPFESFAAARTRLLGLGRAVEVLGPEALRLSILDFARQIQSLYAHGAA